MITGYCQNNPFSSINSSILLYYLSFLYNNSSLHYNELGKISTYLSATSSKFSSSITSYFNLKKENEKLISENLQLKKMESNYKFTQINEDTLNSINSAKVIVNSINKSKNIIIIDKGKLDSINLEMGVISSKGVVGIVKSVTNNYASIISLLKKIISISIRLAFVS